MVLIEIVYCKITGKTRSLPKVHHFIPLEPWSCKKIKGKRKVMGMRPNDKPYFERKEEIKLVLDMSSDGPMFKMLENLMAAVSGANDNGSQGTYEALDKLMKSGIPGMENLFKSDGKGDNFAAKFVKMSDDDKRRFLAAVTGSDGKINSKAAAVLIAAAASNGDPEIANKIVEKMMTGLGDEIDPAMMAALMATTAMASQGASNEEILAAMQRELANSGLSKEEILAKTLLLQKAMSGDNSPAFINKTLQNALNAANLTPDELSKALNVEKVIFSTGSTPEDVAKILLMQSALSAKGAKGADIVKALNNLTDKTNLEFLVRQVQEGLREDGIKTEDITKAISLSRTMESGKVRGLKEIEALLDAAALDSSPGVQEAIKAALASGTLDPAALAKSVIIQKVLQAAKLAPESLSKAIALQKALTENGMSKQEVANAMSLAMALGLDGGKSREAINKALEDLLQNGSCLTEEDFEGISNLAKALQSSSEIPPEAIRLLRKAMKQRRGSVDNVAETLMASLAASGESKESIAKAMVKALKATGATPEEIARTMAQSLEKSGASPEEIAKIMAQALTDAGASTEEIAKTLKETFKKAMAADPSVAADIARTMAEALAAAGASAEDIAQTMQEALAASIGLGGNATADDILDVVETVAQVMAEAGASPEDIAAAMKAAMEAANKNPEIAEELTKSMAKAMAAAGASGEEIARATKAALAASGMSKQQAAQLALEAVAASGASPEEIARTMQKLQKETGFTSEELQQRIIDAMVESGASPEDVAKAIVQNKLLEAIGQTSDKMAKDLLQALRSGDDISLEKLEVILKDGGLTAETAAKVLTLQKILGSLGVDPEELARIILLHKALNAEGASPESIAKIAREVSSRKPLSDKEIERLVDCVINQDIEYDDVMKALKFSRTLEEDRISALPEAIRPFLKSLAGVVAKETIEKLAQELIKSGITNPDTMSRANALAKVMSDLRISPDDISKFMRLQKSMYDNGASPQDIAMLMQSILDLETAHVSKDELADLLHGQLASSLSANDIANLLDLVHAFQNVDIPPELVGQIALMQKSIAAGLKSPEQAAKALAEEMKKPDANPESLDKPLKDLLAKNGVSLEGLESAVLLQKALLASGISKEDLATLMELENAMLAAGKSPQEISAALQDLANKSGLDFKTLAQTMASAMEQGRLKDDDVLVSSNIFEAMTGAGIKPEVMENIRTLQKALERSGASEEQISAILAKATGEGLNKEEIENLLADIMDDPNMSAEEKEKLKSLKESLKQNKLRVAGLTSDKLDQVLALQKVLEASGASQEDINAVIKKATSQGLSDNEIANIVNCALDNADLSETERGRIKALEKSLRSGDLIVKEKAGMLPEVLAEMSQLEEILKEAGYDDNEIEFILAKAGSDGLSQKEIADLVRQIESNPNVSQEKKDQMKALEKRLRAGQLKTSGLDKKSVEQVLLLKKALQSSGASDAEIAAVIAKATSEGLSDKEVTEIIRNAQNSGALSDEDKKKLAALETSLRADGLVAQQRKGVKPELMKNISELQTLLEKSGCGEAEIASILLKATTGDGLTEEEISQLVRTIENSPNLSREDKAALDRLSQALSDGDFHAPGMNEKAMEQILQLKKVLEDSGLSESMINAVIAKATSDGLNESEISQIVNSALANTNLSDEEQQRLRTLELSLRTGGLVVKDSSGIVPDVMEQVSELQKLLEQSGFSQTEIVAFLAKAMGDEGLTEAEIEAVVKKVINNPNISKEDKEKMLIIEQNLRAGNMKTAGMNKKCVEQILLLKKAMEASGASEEEINAVIAKATSQGLNNKEISDIMKKAQTSNKLTKAEKEKLKALEKDLKSGKLKLEAEPGVPIEALDQIVTLQKALEDAGVPADEILSILRQATSQGLSADQVSKVMSKIMNSPNLSKTEKKKLQALENALKAGELQLDEQAQQAVLDMVQAKNKKEILDGLKALLGNNGDVTEEGLAKAMLLQKLMAASDVSPEDLAKVCRIENALIEAGAPANVVSRTIAAALESKNKNLLEKMKKPLEELMKGEAFKMDPKAVEFAAKFQKALTSNDQNSAEDVKRVLENALDIAGLSKEDIAKSVLVQKTLAASGVTPEMLSQVVMLQKALAASGASPEEIADILAKAAGGALSDEAIDELMEKVMSNENMTKEDVEKMIELQKALKGGVLKKAGMTPEALEQIVTLQKALEASGASQEEIAKILAEATSQNLSDEAIEDLMSKALDNSSIDKEDFKTLSELQKNLKEGNLKAMGLTSDVMENVMALQKALEASGASPDEIKKILQQATGEGLSKEQIDSIMEQVLSDPNLSAEQKEKLKALEQNLRQGNLKTGGMKKDVLEQMSSLQKALEASGASQEEIASILAKATGEGLSEEEVAKVMSKIMNNPNLSQEEKEQMKELQATLKSGSLKTFGMTAEKLDKVLLLKKAMEAAGASEEEINATLAKATSDGLTDKEINDIMKKAMASKQLTKEEKEKMKQLQSDLKAGNLKVGGVTAEALDQVVMLQKVLEDTGASQEEISKILSQAASGQGLSEKELKDVMEKVLSNKEISKDEFDSMIRLKENLKDGKLKTSGGVSPEVMEQVVLLQKALEATGASPEEIANIIAKATGPGLSDEAISDLMSKVLNNKDLTPEEREKMMKLQQSLKDGSLKIGNKLTDSIDELLNSGLFDQNSLAKALLVQKILANAGMDPDDLGKAVLLQKAMMEAGASPEKIAKALKDSMLESGMTLDHMMKLMEIELKTSPKLSSKDVISALQFEKVLGSGSAANMILRKLSPETQKLLEELAKGIEPGDTKALIKAMKEALGDSLDDVTLQAIEVNAAMKNAGASEEEIEEMMAMIMNKGGGVSEEFLDNIKKAMETGRNPTETLEMLKGAMEEEMNSVTNSLRSTFLSKIPTQDEIKKTCRTLADKLSADCSTKNDVKLALMDIIDEALQDVMNYEPDSDMLFNYLMVSALAEATDQIDRKGLRPTADELEEIARRGMLDMIERLLTEAELPEAMKKLDVYGRSLDGIKQMLDFLLKDPVTGRQLKRQVAFLFDFEEIEHTTLLGLTLRDILKEAKHKLRPWELAKHRKIKGFRKAKVPKLAYSQVYCFYKVLPEKQEGPPIGLAYEEE